MSFFLNSRHELNDSEPKYFNKDVRFFLNHKSTETTNFHNQK